MNGSDRVFLEGRLLLSCGTPQRPHLLFPPPSLSLAAGQGKQVLSFCSPAARQRTRPPISFSCTVRLSTGKLRRFYAACGTLQRAQKSSTRLPPRGLLEIRVYLPCVHENSAAASSSTDCPIAPSAWPSRAKAREGIRLRLRLTRGSPLYPA